jgi:hypothetical protein
VAVLKVKKSGIHGQGLFAIEAIPAGSLLGQCMTRPASKAGPHTLWLDDDVLVNVTCDLKYINHSKKPNVAYYDDLSVVALKDIKAGQELTHDYGDEWT